MITDIFIGDSNGMNADAFSDYYSRQYGTLVYANQDPDFTLFQFMISTAQRFSN